MAQEQKLPERHPVDPTITCKAPPEGFSKWYDSIKNKRSTSRILQELEGIKHIGTYNLCGKCEDIELCKDSEFSMRVRIPVFEACYGAISWSHHKSKTVDTEEQRIKFINEISKTHKHFQLAKNSLQSTPNAVNRLFQILFHDPLLKRGLKLQRIDNGETKQKHPPEHYFYELMEAIEEGLTTIEENKDKLMNFFVSGAPILPHVAITHQYMCLGFPARENFTTTSVPELSTVLTIQLSKVFRDFTSQSISIGVKSFSTLNYGKPFFKVAATVAICAINNSNPLPSEIDATTKAARKYLYRNKDITLYSDWEGVT